MNRVIKLTLLLCVLCVLLHIAVSNAEIKTTVEYDSIVVKDSDTLWSIANTYCYERRSDIRKTIYEIKELNDLENSTIYPGQLLLVPNTQQTTVSILP